MTIKLNKTLVRILTDIFFLISIVTFSWWFNVILILIASIIFDDYFEVLIFGLIIDSVYGIFGSGFEIPVFSAGALILYVVSILFRNRITVLV